MPDPLRTVGTATPRVDAYERVTGKATYSGDIQLPGMLYARILTSPHPHARITSIDSSAALASPGVSAILTYENCRITWTTGDSRNTRFLFNNPVRFVGEPVAAVVAIDRHVAEESLKKIVVNYEPLDYVLDPELALSPGVVEIHPGGNLSPTRDGTHEPEVYTRGDINVGFADSDHIFEDTYITKHHNNAQMEPRVSVARWEGTQLTVWTPTQGISNCRRDIARDLGLAEDQVRVICEFMGGGFGNKNQCQDFDLITAALARETGRPVKLELTRTEDFLGVHGRWPTRQHYKIGVKRDGTLQAIQLRGYSGMGPYRKSSGDIAGIELFQCPNVRKEVYPAYTNMSVAANFRGPSYPQGVFGIESIMDHVAHELQLDPLDFHIRNLTQKYNDALPYTSWALPECIEQGAKLFDWKTRRRHVNADHGPIKRGVGMAIGIFAARVGRSSAVLRLNSSGQLWVHVGVTDIGTGAKTTMALLAAEAMDMDLDKVNVVSGDTDRSPYSIGESGSRTTNYTGYAVLQAAEKLKSQLKTKGSPTGEQIFIAEATPEPTIKDMARYSSAAHFVEIEVDIELGDIRVVKYLAMHDSGRVINPLTATSQIKGGVTMGIGMALHEELLYDKSTGIPVNPGYYGAKVMTHLDAPEIEVHFIEPDDAHGPYGAKTLGEPPMIPVVGAIANAVFNATGIRVKELPITVDRILGATL